MTWKTPAALLLLGLALLSVPAFAHMAPLTDRELAAGSPDVVVGVVEAVRVRWNETHSLLVTDYELRIEDRLRGNAPEQVTLTIPGGTLGGETHSTCLSTPLAAGARYLLFLQELDRPSLVPVTGGWQGLFREVSGPHGKRLAAHGPGETPLRLANGDAVEFPQLVRAVRDLLARDEAEVESATAADSGPETMAFQPADGGETAAPSPFAVSNPPAEPLVFETLPPDSPFYGADQEQIEYWNLYVHDLFQVSENPTPGWGDRNGASEIAFPTDEEMRRQTGGGWSRGAISMTSTFARQGHIYEADILLNPALEWTLDEDAATSGDPEVFSFRGEILQHLGYAWGFSSVSLGGILSGAIVSRDSVVNLKPRELEAAFLFAEDARNARAYFPVKRIRDGLISSYSVAPAPIVPFYIPVTTSATATRPGGSFDIRNLVTIENPGTEPLINPDLEVYLVPQRFSLDRAILVKRLRVRSTVPSGEALKAGLGRVTVPRNARPGTYYLAFVLRDPRDANQANNRTWGTERVTLTVRR